MKSISTLIYTVWHVDKYKLHLNYLSLTGLMKSWSLTFATQMLFRRSGSEIFDTFMNIILLRIFPL